MKLLIIKFANEVDFSLLTWGTEVTVTHGAVTITGEVFTQVGPMEDPPEPEPPHRHIAAVNVSPGTVEIVIGPSEPIP